jgi:hypothetical protein
MRARPVIDERHSRQGQEIVSFRLSELTIETVPHQDSLSIFCKRRIPISRYLQQAKDLKYRV